MQIRSSLIKRIILTWQIIKAIPKLEWLMPNLETLLNFIPKLDALRKVIEDIKQAEKIMPAKDVIESISAKLTSLDDAVAKIETLGTRPTVIVHEHKNGHEVQTVDKQSISANHEWSRLRTLAQFVNVYERAREIELAWQKIQQDENDALFAFKASHRGDAEIIHTYKKGLADGVRWCLENFSSR